ncbi:MAG: HsdR family type I site-specific deoxyribonuclease [Nitrososphaerota archaeon]
MTSPEKVLVEDHIIRKLDDKGWKYISNDLLERESLEEPLLIPILKRSLKRINPWIGEEEINNIINTLKFTPQGIEGAKKILNYYKFGVPVKLEKERIVRNAHLFDYENIENNEFIVSRQVINKGIETIRNDILLYVNGIPLVNIECKNPTDISSKWEDAYIQIKNYERIVPELYKYVSIGVAAEAIAKYFPIVPWLEEVPIYEWKEDGKDSLDSTIDMLEKPRLLDIINNFLYYRIERGNATKVLARYMQYRAANKIFNRVISNMEGIETKNKGLIWHWQGSGKTLTMIFATNKIYRDKRLGNPTIFFIVDRIELQEQLFNEMVALDMPTPELIESINELKQIIQHDDYRGKRGIFIVLIHKFRPEELIELQKELEKLSQDRETILNRKNVIAFIDEGHRTQYGILAAQMKSMLRKAFFFAFTGTPISKTGRDTYLEFSYPPEEPYLDKYFITDSIIDGHTLKIAYQPRLEHLHLRSDLLEAFLETELEELSEDIRPDIEESVKRKLNTINMFLENKTRISEISKDVTEHFQEEVDGKFKALVVAANRKACVYYKRELDKHLPKEYTEIVMTFNRGDPHEIIEYESELKARYPKKDHEEIRKEIIERFKNDEYPKILIVTDMLLTGFDAPILQAIYLDKPLKEHRLLQAIARTNRPFKGVKECGLIRDYVGILKNLEKAFRIYAKEDIKGVLYDIEDLKREFGENLDKLLTMFYDIKKELNRESMLQAIEIITSDPYMEKEFLQRYNKIRRLYEALGPERTKLERLSEYKWVTAVYIYYLHEVRKGEREKLAEKYFTKTLKYIHRSTEIQNIQKDLPTILFDENYLVTLEQKVKNVKEKAANIVFTLNRFILTEKYRTPIYESLLDRIKRLVEMWKARTKDYEEMYKEGVTILKEMDTIRLRQKQLTLDDLEYSMLLKLEEKIGESNTAFEEAREIAQKLRPLLIPNWQIQTSIRKRVEQELRRHVRQYRSRFGISLGEIDTLYKELLKCVEFYGTR